MEGSMNVWFMTSYIAGSKDQRSFQRTHKNVFPIAYILIPTMIHYFYFGLVFVVD